ncbi:SLATT domain-containing protein [Rhizosaccharibacter radicis]|uniref:SLATT domain-containing protein n=1 Tax=Rhizosaccharibacter radicis TaxID=2782605 RepID=A0ABT1VW21_9PROT|nr:SLATT domain-containing protein [Acetobacteraceae bacterium KSS12]
MTLEEAKADLLRRMKITAGSRFNAAERLESKDRTYTWLGVAATIAVITLTVIPLAIHQDDKTNAYIGIVAVVSSVVILASNLMQYSSSYALNAARHHQCALEINACARKLRLLVPFTFEQLQVISEEYDNLLARHGTNHQTVDFERYKREHSWEFEPTTKPAASVWRLLLLPQSTTEVVGTIIGFLLTAATLWVVSVYLK